MAITSYTRDQLLAQLKRKPMEALQAHCKQRAVGKREMEYTDLAVGFGCARAYENNIDFQSEFQEDEFWPHAYNFRPGKTLAYCLMRIYGDTHGSAADRAYTHATALKNAFDDPDIDTEDVADLVKRSGGIRAMVDAQRTFKRVTSNPLRAQETFVKRDEIEMQEDEEDVVGDNEDLQLGPGDLIADVDDDTSEQLEPVPPTWKKVKAEKAKRKSQDQLDDEKLERIKKLARELGLIVIRPRASVLEAVCKLKSRDPRNLLIERQNDDDEWTELDGLRLES